MNEGNPLLALQSLTPALTQRRLRILAVLQGERGWCLDQASVLQGQGSILWVSDQAPAGAWQLPKGKANHELGREADAVVMDLYSGVDVDTLAAVAGLVRAGGWLLLLAPPLPQWPAFADPEYARITVEPFGIAGVRRGFLHRMAQRLAMDSRVLKLSSGDAPTPVPLPEGGDRMTVDDLGCLNHDQRQVVEAVLKVASGHRHRPLVVMADRGRGKSAALGIAAARLIGEGRRLLVTAPRPACAETLQAFAARGRGHDTGSLQFVAPDLLVHTLPPADVLLVDEAAAIAPGILLTLLTHYSRVVFAGTVQGYEGTGQGFATRFFRHLDQRTPGWKLLQMAMPVRWAEGDPLEACINDLLLLNACDETTVTAPGEVLPASAWGEITGQLDGSDEHLLRQVHGLLVSAHYRTRPSDLRAMMDGPNLRTFVLRAGADVLAVVMMAEEGLLPDELAAAIRDGRRRPHGHVLAQSLCVHLNVGAALYQRCWRVVRIAVHSRWRRLGLGRLCLARLEQQARVESVALVGSVFAATDDVLPFWRAAGFEPVRLGLTRESTSGAYPVVVVKPVAGEGQAMCDQARRRFEQTFPESLADRAADWSPQLILAVWNQGRFHSPLTVNAEDREDMRHFLNGHKTYENAAVAINHHLHQWMYRLRLADVLDSRALSVLICKVLQKHSWPELARITGLDGQKAARAVLREAVRHLFHADPPQTDI